MQVLLPILMQNYWPEICRPSFLMRTVSLSKLSSSTRTLLVCFVLLTTLKMFWGAFVPVPRIWKQNGNAQSALLLCSQISVHWTNTFIMNNSLNRASSEEGDRRMLFEGIRNSCSIFPQRCFNLEDKKGWAITKVSARFRWIAVLVESKEQSLYSEAPLRSMCAHESSCLKKNFVGHKDATG